MSRQTERGLGSNHGAEGELGEDPTMSTQSEKSYKKKKKKKKRKGDLWGPFLSLSLSLSERATGKQTL